MSSRKGTLRIAWLVPTAQFGPYWVPLLKEFGRQYPNFKFYSGLLWQECTERQKEECRIESVGRCKTLMLRKSKEGYDRGIYFLSPGIIPALLRFRPNLVLAEAFSLWTLLAILFKRIGRWRVLILYDGSSPNVDLKDSKLRTVVRRWMARRADRMIANSRGGMQYLIETLGVALSSISQVTYLVPDPSTLIKKEITLREFHRPLFLYTGQVITRKGIRVLLEAVKSLGPVFKGTLVIAGDGAERQTLEKWAEENGLADRIHWTGWLSYEVLGDYVRNCDVFVFPTFEDTWGMVLTEAMACGKPIIASTAAGASEWIQEGQSGFLVNPGDVRGLADAIHKFIQEPSLIPAFGALSKTIADDFSPEKAMARLSDVLLKEGG